MPKFPKFGKGECDHLPLDRMGHPTVKQTQLQSRCKFCEVEIVHNRQVCVGCVWRGPIDPFNRHRYSDQPRFTQESQNRTETNSLANGRIWGLPIYTLHCPTDIQQLLAALPLGIFLDESSTESLIEEIQHLMANSQIISQYRFEPAILRLVGRVMACQRYPHSTSTPKIIASSS